MTAPGKLIKYNKSIETRLAPSFFRPTKPSTVMHFMTGSGFGHEVLKALYTQRWCKHHGLTFQLADQFWNAKCSEREGVRCYFSDTSSFVQSLEPSALAGAEHLVSYAATGVRLDVDDAKYDEIKQRNIFLKVMRDMTTARLTELRKLFALAWRLRPAVEKEVEITKKRLKLKRYLSIHVRRGDKIQKTTAESAPLDLATMKSRILAEVGRTKCNTLFVATDDAAAVDELRALLPQVHVVSTAAPESGGFDQDRFNQESFERAAESTRGVIVDIELLRGGIFYFGTSSSAITKVVRLLGVDKWHDMEPAETPVAENWRHVIAPDWVHQ
jgi:hypothetical protein